MTLKYKIKSIKYCYSKIMNIFCLSSQNAAAPSPLGQMNPQDGMSGGPMPPGFFPVST